MPENLPLISVLVTVFNRENLIFRCLQSILDSDFSDYEVIIVDDGSTDKSVEVISAFIEGKSNFKLFKNPVNLGDYPNRNKAAGYAKGKYLKYVDSDDEISKDCLGILANHMGKNPDIQIGISGATARFKCKIVPTETVVHHYFKHNKYLCVGPLGWIIRTDYFFAMGQLPTERHISDFLFLLKVVEKESHILEFSTDLITWNEHPGQEINQTTHQVIYRSMYDIEILNFLSRTKKLPESCKKKLLKIYARRLMLNSAISWRKKLAFLWPKFITKPFFFGSSNNILKSI